MTTDRTHWIDAISQLPEAVAFLSRLPVGTVVSIDTKPDLARTARAFPVAGVVIALPALFTGLVLAILNAPPMLSAALIVTVMVITTGALHEDGLADVADGFWGGATREDKLEIMRDSRTGAYGVSALLLTFLLRTVALSALLGSLTTMQFAAVFLATAALSRGAIVWLWSSLPAARSEGLSRNHGEPAAEDSNIAFIACGVIALVLLVPAAGFLPALAVLATGIAATAYFRSLSHAHIGGHTGDTLGASQQIAETTLFIATAIAI